MEKRIIGTGRFLVVCSALFLCLTVGCGQQAKPTGKVQGTVMFKGKPLTNATVVFRSKDGMDQCSVELDSSGAFVLPKAIVTGEYRVALLPVLRTDMGPDESQAAMDAFKVNGKYQIPEESPLEFSVQTGQNTATLAIP